MNPLVLFDRLVFHADITVCGLSAIFDIYLGVLSLMVGPFMMAVGTKDGIATFLEEGRANGDDDQAES